MNVERRTEDVDTLLIAELIAQIISRWLNLGMHE